MNTNSIEYLIIWSSLSSTWGNLKVRIIERAKPIVFLWNEVTLSTYENFRKQKTKDNIKLQVRKPHKVVIRTRFKEEFQAKRPQTFYKRIEKMQDLKCEQYRLNNMNPQ